MPKISIIIPMYKVEQYLRRCLDSVQNQTFKDWQAICVDDGSPDKSGKIAEEYAARDKRFIVVHKKNGGLSDARNTGLKIAKGEYVMFLDSDDFIHSQTMEILLKASKCADVIAFDYDVKFYRKLQKIIKNGGNVQGLLPKSRNKIYDVNKIYVKHINDIFTYATERNKNIRPWRIRHCFPAMRLYRRTLIHNIPFINGIIMEDFPWWTKVMATNPRTAIVRLPLYFYMPNACSILNSSHVLRMLKSLYIGLTDAFQTYCSMTSKQQFYYLREFLWPFVIIFFGKARQLLNSKDSGVAVSYVRKLEAMGVFDNPVTIRDRKYKRRIQKLLSK